LLCIIVGKIFQEPHESSDTDANCPWRWNNLINKNDKTIFETLRIEPDSKRKIFKKGYKPKVWMPQMQSTQHPQPTCRLPILSILLFFKHAFLLSKQIRIKQRLLQPLSVLKISSLSLPKLFRPLWNKILPHCNWVCCACIDYGVMLYSSVISLDKLSINIAVFNKTRIRFVTKKDIWLCSRHAG
jgi:hypothetical protein